MSNSSPSRNSELVWLITGASTGLGREISHAALSRGDKVIATARGSSLSKLADLKDTGAVILELDVTASLERLSEIAKEAVGVCGRVDVVVNNAGYLLAGTIEECTPEETFSQFNTNLFGALNVTRAFLPYMRERKKGTILWAGSAAGWLGLPYSGIYGATKWAMRGISRSLHKEISPLGLHSICVDFGYFRTPILSGEKLAPTRPRIPDYAQLSNDGADLFQSYDGIQPGDPSKAAQVLVDLVHGTGSFSSTSSESPSTPTNLVLGSDAFKSINAALDHDLENRELWKDVTLSTDFGGPV